MLKRACVYLDVKDLKALERLGNHKGSLKLAQMIRVAISDYVKREVREAALMATGRRLRAEALGETCCAGLQEIFGYE